MAKVKYFRNPKSEDFLLGVPATDLSENDIAGLEEMPRKELEAYIAQGGEGWGTEAYPEPEAAVVSDVPPSSEASATPDTEGTTQTVANQAGQPQQGKVAATGTNS